MGVGPDSLLRSVAGRSPGGTASYTPRALPPCALCAAMVAANVPKAGRSPGGTASYTPRALLCYVLRYSAKGAS